MNLSTREAGKLAGVSQTTVAGWRAWLQEGENPETLPMPQPKTLQGVDAYLRMESDIEARRTALTIAADRLEAVVAGLRHEVASPTAAIEREARGQRAAVREPDIPYRATLVFDILGVLLELDAVRDVEPDPFTAAVAAAERIIASIDSDTLSDMWRAFMHVSIEAGHYDPAEAPDWSSDELAELRKSLPPLER